MTATDLVLVAHSGPVVTLTLNRPEKRNALNLALLEQFCAAIGDAEEDPSARVLVLRGAGPVFCSGLDLAEAAEKNSAHASAERIESALQALASARLMTIAAVQGAAMAGGAGLMAACDFAVATKDAKFGFPEVRRGIVPALIMTLLRRQLRERDAREVLLLGKPFTADHALAIGFIQRVVSDEAALLTEVQSIVSWLLQGGPETLAETKRLWATLWPSPLSDDLRQARAVHLAARTSPEATEGIAAFNEKRPPKWAK